MRELLFGAKESVMGNEYITGVAKNLIGKLGITWRDARRFGESFSAQTLYVKRERDVRREVREMRPETLGKIAVHGLSKHDPRTERQPKPSGVTDEGRTSLYAVHCGSYLSKYDSGRNILIDLVVTALIAEMTDQLREKMYRDMESAALTSEGM